MNQIERRLRRLEAATVLPARRIMLYGPAGMSELAILHFYAANVIARRDNDDLTVVTHPFDDAERPPSLVAVNW